MISPDCNLYVKRPIFFGKTAEFQAEEVETFAFLLNCLLFGYSDRACTTSTHFRLSTLTPF